ncbi:MAG: hypothetical protein QOH25_2663 [Acidobacteriota bacterium]|jgi:hypothetical protein|nr:hypothetical protein [Acidobacteriota bacterium]
MADPSTTPTGRKASAKDETGLLEVLRLLIETEKATTTSDLLKYATQYGAPEAEERLRVLEAENIPLDLAFDSISVHLRLLAYKQNSELLASCRGQKVGLILPLPPHVPNLFLPVAEVTFLEPGENSVLGSLSEFTDQAVKGGRACRAKAQEMQALVFEVFREGGNLFAEVAVADVLEPKMLPVGIRLIANLRPHRNPGDVQIHPASEVSFI